MPTLKDREAAGTPRPPSRGAVAAAARDDSDAKTLYEQDFFAWTNSQAALLRSGRLAQADIEHIAEEIEGMGKSELRELENRLAALLLHLLKWQFQPQRRGRGWELAIREQRRKLRRHIDQNPSLRSRLDQAMDDAYGDAILTAARETDLPEETFPPLCPYTVEQTLDDCWLPDGQSAIR
ncbi:DUF29 domain-containing protein [uncultured Thiodictyon sp.]|uniref:DUF29 domain-containing protein n=1 Tax=uncultured Thiodictyon sp. TaxID=1846217 RepID=UPI0025ED8F35|nr:DUF29 domain-containing protein [uncultured Thiodictyon sp.]